MLLTTAYPSEGDQGVPYYVAAARNVAKSRDGVLLLDTCARLPSFSEGSALGYYLDGVHYSDTEFAAFAAVMNQLVEVAAEAVSP